MNNINNDLIIPLISGVLGIASTAVVNYLLNKDTYKNLKLQNQEIQELKQENRQLLSKNALGDIRKISNQLDLLKDELTDDDDKYKKNCNVWLMGINALGPIYHGKEILVNLLKANGKLRVLLLNPKHRNFKKRSDFERDDVGRIAAEMYASLYILKDIRNQLIRDRNFRQANNIEVRLYDNPPDRSLIIGFMKEAHDGIILKNEYSRQEKSRGISGEMYVIEYEGAGKDAYENNIGFYADLWDNNSESIRLDDLPLNLEKIKWPFSYADAK